MLEAKPVYAYLSAQAFGTPATTSDMVIGFGAAGLLCGTATLAPIAVALRKLENQG
jgi:hypothetical protein